MSRVLAFDLARFSGAAWRRNGAYGTSSINLGKPGAIDGHLLVLKEWTESLIVEVEPDIIAVENDTGRGLGARTLQTYHAVVRLVAAERGVAFEYGFNSSRARKWALGRDAADKNDAQAKARAMFPIPAGLSEDEVDAIVLLEAVSAEEGYFARLKAMKPKDRRAFLVAEKAGIAKATYARAKARKAERKADFPEATAP